MRAKEGLRSVSAVGKVTAGFHAPSKNEERQRLERPDATAGSSGVWRGVVLFHSL